MSQLEGDYQCDYCNEPYAQEGRFTVPFSNATSTGIEEFGSFCLPECAAAYNAFKTREPESGTCRMRHDLIERRCGRRVKLAPLPNLLARNNVRGRGIERKDWLPEARKHLNAQEREVAERELVVDGNLALRVAARVRK